MKAIRSDSEMCNILFSSKSFDLIIRRDSHFWLDVVFDEEIVPEATQ